MDFLDPKRQRMHHIQLIIGYVFVAVAILIGTVVLLYQAYGFGLNKKGEVVQSGLVFVSSTPSGSQIYLNGVLNNAQTDARLSLVSGNYFVQIKRTGYHAWQRPIVVEGGAVAHYDYPFLVPTTLTSSVAKTYAAAPGLATQSPDRRWLLIQQPGSNTVFDEYDLKNPKTDPVPLAIPSNLLSTGSNQSWQAIEWASDNKHVLLQHTYDGKTEFLVLDRTDATQTVNLNSTLALKSSPARINLRNKKFDQYYVYDTATQDLQTATLSNPTPVAFLQHVLEYQPYGSDIMLYASSDATHSGKVSIDLLQDGKTYMLREVAAGTKYLLNLTQYNGSWYVGLGAASENKTYIYKNPVSQLNSKLNVLVPIYVLKTTDPNYLAFSANAQFIMAENGSQFAVYDAFNDKGYTYDTGKPLDAPQPHATWMDGDRITYVSKGKLVMFDYDHANPQTLVSASSAYSPFFDPDYKFLDLIAPSAADGKTDLTTTQLRTLADQ